MTADRILRAGVIGTIIFLAGCTPSTPVWPTTDPAIDLAVATQMSAAQTATAGMLPTEVTSSATSSLQPIQDVSDPAPASSLAGLIVSSQNLFRVQPDGTPLELNTTAAEAISPDLTLALTNSNGDLWLVNLSNHQPVRLTMTETRVECCATWWPNHPEKILLLSKSLDTSNGVANQGYLTVVKQDGSGYLVLDPDHLTSGIPAVSADGIWIAYGNGASGWIFGGELGPQEVKPADYGLHDSAGTISAPVWNPDGTRLAWQWQESGGLIAPLILNITEKTYQLGPTYSMDGNKFAGAMQWNPSGNRLIYSIESTNPDTKGVWMMDTANGAGVVRITDHPLHVGVWSPDGGRLALSSYQPDADGNLWIFDQAANTILQVDLENLLPSAKMLAWQ